MATSVIKGQIRVANVTLSTGAAGTVSSGLPLSGAKILAAYAEGYAVEVYVNSQGIQGYALVNPVTGERVPNTTVQFVAVILNY